MNLRQFILFTCERLGVHYPQQECKAVAVRLLKECAEGYRGYEHLVEPERELATFIPAEHFSALACDVEELLCGFINRMATGEPLQYVLGYEWFCGHKFNVCKGVLIPRVETEELVGNAVSAFRGSRILDICSGSGCIALSMAARLPDTMVFGCDISGTALELSGNQQIFSCNGNKAEADFFECDILSNDAFDIIVAKCGSCKFDMIVSNPPYVCEEEKMLMRTNVLDFEPHQALFVPDDNPLEFYRAIALLAVRLLNKGGILYFEINERFGEQTKEILQNLGFGDCLIVQDIFGKDRFVSAVMR